MSLTTHVEALDYPNDSDVAIQFTNEQLHHCIDLTQEEAETLLVELQGVVA